MQQDKYKCLSQQLSEVELLQFMFPDNEFKCDTQDLELVKQYVSAIENKQTDLLDHDPPNITFTIDLKIIDDISCIERDVEFTCSLPSSYPLLALPIISVRCSAFTRQSHQKLAQDLNEFIKKEVEESEGCLLSSVQYVRDNAASFFQPTISSKCDTDEDISNIFMREYLWFHHIYNKDKKRNIVDWARQHKLTGFSMTGKPGLICIEGTKENVTDYVMSLRNLSWQKMTSKLQEQSEYKEEGVDAHRKFQKFEELPFEDRGLLLKYLESHGLQHIFKDIYGVGNFE